MSALLSRAEIVEGLVRMGVPREAAERQADTELHRDRSLIMGMRERERPEPIEIPLKPVERSERYTAALPTSLPPVRWRAAEASPPCAAVGAVARSDRMNKTEARRAAHLEALRVAGLIKRWDFQPMKLRLADYCYLTPDFRVVLTTGEIELEDVKGRKGAKYYCTEDSKIKIRIAAEMHPMFRFTIVWELKGEGWGCERF